MGAGLIRAAPPAVVRPGSALLGSTLALMPRAALAHDGQPPAAHDLWEAWTPDPVVFAALALAAFLYMRGLVALRRRTRPGGSVGLGPPAAYAAGLAALLLALASPLDALSAGLLSAHMAQHLALMLVAAPLLVLGARPAILAWALPTPLRPILALGRHLRPLTHPAVVLALHAAIVWAWHLPALYGAALRSAPLHVLEHLTFTASAALFWAVVARAGRPGGLEHGAALLYLFLASMQGGVLGALMAFSPALWYPEQWLTTLEDQRLAGLLMWVPAGTVYLLAGLLVFGSWARAERRPRRGLVDA